MKFMLLMQGRQSDFAAMGAWAPADIQAHIRFMMDLAAELTASGELVLAEGLEMPERAKIVRAQRADAPVVTEGPFAETKEFLAGFWLVEVVSAERAVAIAAKASSAPGKGGAPIGIPIELRAVGCPPEM